MKKLVFNSFLSILIMTMITACGGGSSGGDSQVDTIAPVITILGDNPATINQGSIYTDAGATVIDNNDSSVTVTTNGVVNTSIAGTYTLTYSSTDVAGNTATKVRTVNVVASVNTSHSVEGIIRDYTTGDGVPGVRVSVGSNSATTDANGAYSVPVDDSLAGNVVVTVSGAGIATTGEIVTIPTAAGTNATLTVNTVPVAFTGNFNPAQGFTATVDNSPANVVIGAGTLVDANGVLPVGNVTVQLTPIDPAQNIDLMPGDMLDEAGEPIQSFGALTIEFTDASGNALNLGSGQTATIRIPVSNKGAVANIPATIPLFYFDNVRGFWVKEGSATLSANKAYYEGTVSHFTTWNVDDYFDSISISGCVQDINGNKLRSALVRMNGFDYNGKTTTRTNANGNFTIPAMKDRISLLVAFASGKKSNTIKAGPSSTNITLSECLVVGDLTFTVTLDWSLNPNDLDAHMFGPNGYHIYFSHKGSLTSGEFAKLDVDDQDGYGPEVITALKFTQAGTYHYAVHHYEGTSNIVSSSARVELNFKGDLTVFTPPAGQTTRKGWWNVFDIIVDADNNISIRPVNTLTTTAPDTGSRFSRGALPLKK